MPCPALREVGGPALCPKACRVTLLGWLTVAKPPSSSSLSCRFGRKPILIFSYLLLGASGSGAAFSPTFSIYAVFRFLCGFSISGISLSTAILSEPQGCGQGTGVWGAPA